MRLSGRRAFAAVFEKGVKRTSGPLIIFGLKNDLAHSRLGLSVSRAVGNAVKRNRIKRLLREAFRLNRRALPAGIDFVIVVRPHATKELADYAELLGRAATSLAAPERPS
jgi:ribonuclease P protein component